MRLEPELQKKLDDLPSWMVRFCGLREYVGPSANLAEAAHQLGLPHCLILARVRFLAGEMSEDAEA